VKVQEMETLVKDKEAKLKEKDQDILRYLEDLALLRKRNLELESGSADLKSLTTGHQQGLAKSRKEFAELTDQSSQDSAQIEALKKSATRIEILFDACFARLSMSSLRFRLPLL